MNYCYRCGYAYSSTCQCHISANLQKILDKLTQITEILERKREEGDF